MTARHGPPPRGAPLAAAALLTATHLLASASAIAEPLLLPPRFPAPLDLQQSEPCRQRGPQVARLEDDRLIAVWIAESGSVPRVLGRFLTADGVPLGDEIELARAPSGVLGEVQVSRHLNRGFAVLWSSGEGALGEVARMRLETFDENGEKTRSADVEVAPGAALTGIALDFESIRLVTAVAWSDGAAAWLRLFDGNLRPLTGSIAAGHPEAAAGFVGTVDVVRGIAGPSVVVWEEGSTLAGPPPLGLTAVRARTIYDDGTAGGPAFTVNGLPAHAAGRGGLAPSISASPNDLVVVWSNQDAPGVPPGIYGQRLEGPMVSLLGDSFQIHSTPLATVGPPQVSSTPIGFAVAWQGREAAASDPLIFARVFTGDGEARSDDFALWRGAPGRIQSQPALQAGLGLNLLWRDHLPLPAGPAAECAADSRLLVRSARFACEPSRHRACMFDGRFSIETVLRIPGGPPRYDPVEGERISPQAAFFTFWDGRPDNVELVVKLLDARTVNDRFWFFSGALSNRDYRIHVRDLLTSRTGDYFSRFGPVAAGPRSFADLRTFTDPEPAPLPAKTPAAMPAAPGFRSPPPAAEVSATASPCGGETLCLHGQRFRVRVTWSDPLGGGAARTAALSDLGGYFWFVREGNPEVAVKLLDGRAINGYFWAFVGGLSNRPYTVTVEDEQTGGSWSYSHPGGSVMSHADTRALAGSPFPGCPIC